MKCEFKDCQRKVNTYHIRCSCSGLYCNYHKFFDLHECSFDYIYNERKRLRKENPIVVASKVKKI